MNKYIIRKLNALDKKKLLTLKTVIHKNLPRQDYLVPYTEDDFKKLFNQNYYTNYGAFDKKFLAGSVRLETNQNELEEYKKKLDITDKLCNLNHGLIHPNYRGRSLLPALINKATEQAAELDYKYAMCTIHPENISVLKAIKKIAFKHVSEIVNKYGWPRKIYIKEL